MEKGGYIMLEAPNGPSSVEVTLVATGSEVALAAEARKQLLAMNIQTRLVSMPSTTVFDRQDKEYRDFVLGEGRPVVAIEAGRTDGWWKYIRGAGTVIGLDRFGESAPASELLNFLVSPSITLLKLFSTFFLKEINMTIRVAITGYGRIGRNVLRAFYEERNGRTLRSLPLTILLNPKPPFI